MLLSCRSSSWILATLRLLPAAASGSSPLTSRLTHSRYQYNSGPRIAYLFTGPTLWVDSNTLLMASGSGVPSNWNASFRQVHHPREPVEQQSPQSVCHTTEGPFPHCVAVLHPPWCHPCAAAHQHGDNKNQRGRHYGGRRTCWKGRRELWFQGNLLGAPVVSGEMYWAVCNMEGNQSLPVLPNLNKYKDLTYDSTTRCSLLSHFAT